jgi:hypothetical protein
MTEVKAVKIADGENAARLEIAETGDASMSLHSD